MAMYPEPDYLETLIQLLRTIVRLPPGWFRTVLALIVLSVINVTWSRAEGVAIALQVTNTTVLLLTLMWLPALLQLFALAGGAIKAPGAEFSSPGLEQLLQAIAPEAQDEVVGALKVVLEDIKQLVPPEERQELRQLESQLAKPYQNLTPSEARRALRQLAQRYREVLESPKGARRNFMMETIAAAMQPLTAPAQFSDQEIQDYIRSDHYGYRLVGLSSLLERHDTDHFENVLYSISHSRSALEQLSAMQVMLQMVPSLPEPKKSQLRQVLETQRRFDESKHQWIQTDSDRWHLSEQLLTKIS